MFVVDVSSTISTNFYNISDMSLQRPDQVKLGQKQTGEDSSLSPGGTGLLAVAGAFRESDSRYRARIILWLVCRLSYIF